MVANSLITPQTPLLGFMYFDASVGTALRTVVTGGANGSKVIAIFASCTEVTPRLIRFGVTRAGNFYSMGAVNTPIGQGGFWAGFPAVDMMDPRVIPGLPQDEDGQHYLLLEPGDLLQAYLTTALVGQVLEMFAIGGHY